MNKMAERKFLPFKFRLYKAGSSNFLYSVLNILFIAKSFVFFKSSSTNKKGSYAKTSGFSALGISHEPLNCYIWSRFTLFKFAIWSLFNIYFYVSSIAICENWLLSNSKSSKGYTRMHDNLSNYLSKWSIHSFLLFLKALRKQPLRRSLLTIS